MGCLPSLELAKLFEGFPSCSELHCTPTFVTLHHESFSTPKAQNREENKRLNGLSYFIQDTEQKIERYELIKKGESKEKVSRNHSNSDFRKLCKSIWSSTKKTAVQRGPVFSRKGNKVVFNFQHFVYPDTIIEEYTRACIRNKPYFVKSETLKSLEATCDQKNVSNVESKNCRSKPYVKHDETQKRLDNKKTSIPGRKHNKVTENILKNKKREEELRSTKKIQATHNFVYEFNPSHDSTSNFETNACIRRLTNPITKKDSPSECVTSDINRNLKKRENPTSTALLPKLRTHGDSATSNSEKRNYSQDTNLPFIKRPDVKGTKETFKEFNTERKQRHVEISEIDHEVEKVKSNWQILRNEKNRIHRKGHFENSRAKNLYDTLGKVTDEIDRIQKSYLDPKANPYLRRGAIKALETPPRSLKEDAAEIRDKLFPRQYFYHGHDKSNVENLRDVQHNTRMKEIAKPRKSFLKNITGDLKSFSQNNIKGLNACGLKSGPENYRGWSKKVTADVEKYFESYMNNMDNHLIENEGRKIEESELPSNSLTKILTRLSLNPLEIHDIPEDEFDIDYDKIYTTFESSKQGKDSGVEIYEVDQNPQKKTFSESISNKEETHLRKHSDKVCSDTSIQTNPLTARKENDIFRVGFNETDSELPQNIFSYIQKSEYLKKDLSLKPM